MLRPKFRLRYPFILGKFVTRLLETEISYIVKDSTHLDMYRYLRCGILCLLP